MLPQALMDDTSIVKLVCGDCWTRLFALESFQTAWTAKKLYDGFSYRTTWKDVRRSADTEGCNWCNLLIATRDDTMPRDPLKVTVNFRIQNGAESPEKQNVLRLIINDKLNSCFFFYTTSGDNATTHIAHRILVSEVESPVSYKLALECLSECVRHHHESCPKPEKTILPNRVIDCSNPLKPKICLTEKTSNDFYAALSYVWGEQQPLSTTENISDFVNEGFDIQQSPQTIRDAISSTHRFGLRYLWVDALCILQDSREDKDRELANMCRIYRDAHVTIIAASAHKVSQGFLNNRPKTTTDIFVPFRCPDGKIGTMSLSPVWKQYDEMIEPINSRGWCLQERLLSTRALIYASHTLQYSCQRHTVNIGNSICPQSRLRLPKAMFLPDRCSNVGLSETRRAWHDVIENYTRRSITVPGDKLIALGGISEQFQHTWGTRYLAGLWENTLLRDLLWFKSYEDRFPRPEEYRAPSWSWAAVEGYVIPESTDYRIDTRLYKLEGCEILECETTLVSETVPFGAVTAGILTVNTALIKNIIWNPVERWCSIFLQNGGGVSGGDGEKVCIGDAYPDSADEVSKDVCVLPMLWSRESAYAVGLIVVPAENNKQGCFRRVGYFRSPEEIPNDLAWFEDAPRQIVSIV